MLSVSHPLEVWTLIFSPTSIFSGFGGDSDPPSHGDWDREHRNTAAVTPLDTRMPIPSVLPGPISQVAVPMQSQCLGREWTCESLMVHGFNVFHPIYIYDMYILFTLKKKHRVYICCFLSTGPFIFLMANPANLLRLAVLYSQGEAGVQLPTGHQTYGQHQFNIFPDDDCTCMIKP